MKKNNLYYSDFDDWFPTKHVKRKRERAIVTVCIAAICKGYLPDSNLNVVIGATDRMLTAGDIEFEPKLANKIVVFSNSIFGLFAGDFGLQTELVREVLPTVIRRIEAEPTNWWEVRHVAELYADAIKKAHQKRAENAILMPQGLTLRTFLSLQKELNPEYIKQLASKLAQFDSPSIEAIFCGIDMTGAHIYVVNNSANVVCHDVVGFATIGAGYWHADSQFMFANHNPFKGFAETLLLTYSAKKRAEVAPGVGSDTDMFSIGPELGACVPSIGLHVIQKLQKTYESVERKKQRIDQGAQAEMSNFIQEITEKAEAAAKQKQQEATSSSASTGQPLPSEQSQPSADSKEKKP